MMLLLISAAWAQDTDLLPGGTYCSTPTPRPIAGTAGYRTAGEAIQRTASTYSASAFAARHLLHDGPEADLGGWTTRSAIDVNVTYGAADIPMFHPAAVEGTGSDTTCDAAYQVATRPLDIETANVGIVVRQEGFGFIFATSLLYAAPVAGDQFTRILYTSFIGPIYATTLSATAPVWDMAIPGEPDFTGPTGAVRMEWMLGATASAGSVNFAAAYLSSVGGYAHLSEAYTGAYVFYGGLRYEDAVLEAGIDRFFVPDLEGMGLASAAYQDIPYLLGDGEAEQEEAEQETQANLKERMRVGRFTQQNIGGIVDAAARYRLRPDAAISELALGVHTPGFHLSRDPEEDDYTEFGALLSGGFVSTPAAWSQGLPAAQLPSARAALQIRGDGARFSLNFYFNDPEQLQLYPFARNALSYQILAEGQF